MKSAVKIRDRIREFRRVKASELKPHPANWRTHPQAQRDAMKGILAEVGYVDALMVRKHDRGYQILDGHLRAEVTPDMEVPVLVVDLDDEETTKVLLTFDPLAAMATADAGKLDALLREVSTGDAALQKMLAELAKDAGLYAADVQPPEDFGTVDEDIPIEHICPKCGYAFSGGKTTREAVEQ